MKNRVIWGKGDMKWKFKRKKWHELDLNVSPVLTKNSSKKRLKSKKSQIFENLKNVWKFKIVKQKLKNVEKIRKNNWKLINSTFIYVYMIYCQYLMKVGRSDMTKMKRWQEAEDRKVL